MKEKIKELSKKYGKIEEESLDIEDKDFQKSTIVFDTNILIKIYKLKEETREELFKILENPKINKRLYIPYQILLEFFLKRKDLLKKADDFETKLSERIDKNLKTNILTNICSEKKWTGGFENYFLANEDICTELCELDITEHTNVIKSEYEEIISKYKKNKITLDKDPILDRLNKIFKDKIGEEISIEGYNEIKNEAIIRKWCESNFPGSQDSSKTNGNEYGDFIVWKDLVDNRFEHGIIYVSEEKKSDWADKGKLKLYLKIEYKKATNGKINIINLENFMKRVSPIYKVSLNDNILEDLAKVSKETENRKKIISKFNNLDTLLSSYFFINPSTSYKNLDFQLTFNKYLECLSNDEKIKFLEELEKNLKDFEKK